MSLQTQFYLRNNNLLNVIDGLFANHDDNKLLSKFHQTTTGCALKKQPIRVSIWFTWPWNHGKKRAGWSLWPSTETRVTRIPFVVFFVIPERNKSHKELHKATKFWRILEVVIKWHMEQVSFNDLPLLVWVQKVFGNVQDNQLTYILNIIDHILSKMPL